MVGLTFCGAIQNGEHLGHDPLKKNITEYTEVTPDLSMLQSCI